MLQAETATSPLSESVTPGHAKPIFAVETLAQCRAGVERLMEAHGEEFTYYKDVKGPVDPDWDLAATLEAKGRFKVVTARAAARMVGYFMIVSAPSPHYRKLEHTFDDTFYLEPEYRTGFGLYRFVKFAVEQMAATPATILVVAEKYGKSLGPIWKRLGFLPEEIRWTKVNGNRG
jgi:hypothetical protein